MSLTLNLAQRETSGPSFTIAGNNQPVETQGHSNGSHDSVDFDLDLLNELDSEQFPTIFDDYGDDA